MSTGKRIYQLRKKKKLSQTTLGKMAGLSDTYIGKLEKDKANATGKVLESLAKALDTTVTFLLYGHDELVKNDLVPTRFVVADEAREYIKWHKVLASPDFDVYKMSDEEVLNFANDLLKQMELVSFKYKK
jgi:transcriptional regulator with XRE-family HTH domain